MARTSVFQVIALILALPACIAAQQEVFFPAVRQIRAESRNNLVRITWIDSPQARGPVYIYRSVRPFSDSVPVNIRPVVVKYGTQNYIDDIEDMTSIFYFIAASDVSGRRYETIIPQVNSISINLAGSQTPGNTDQMFFEQPLTPVLIYEPQGISNLWTRNDGDRVIITYTNSNPQKTAVLYRSTRPLMQPYDLLNAVIVKSGITSPFIDVPLPGQSWYYAVIYEDEISDGSFKIRPGINATASAVTIYGDMAPQDFMRPVPLPFLTLNNYVSGGFLPDTPKRIPQDTESSELFGNSQRNERPPLELKKPRVFAMDLQVPATGEEAALYQIVKEYFEKFEWENARDNLQDYLSLPRSSDVQARARFYLGQTHYFTGNYREALWEFLFFRSINPPEANRWIDAVLAAMVH